MDLVVAKSFGTAGLPWAVEHGVPGVRLTPLLTVPEIAVAVRALDTSSLLIGGTADAWWSTEALAGVAARVHEEPGADHALQLPGWRDSQASHRRALEAVAAHLRQP